MKTAILAIDPGPVQSAFVELEREDDGPWVIVDHKKEQNESTILKIRLWGPHDYSPYSDQEERHVVCEMIASYGMPVGAEVFETCVTIGRILQVSYERLFAVERLKRQDVKLHMCKTARATDATIRQAVIDRFGTGKEEAIGTKKEPGPLYGIKGDEWQALALGLTYADSLRDP